MLNTKKENFLMFIKEKAYKKKKEYLALGMSNTLHKNHLYGQPIVVYS